MNNILKLSAIEQFNIDRRIAAEREAAELSDGETVLQVIEGGYANWKEAFAEIVKSDRGANPVPDAPGVENPGSTATT